MMNSWPSRLLAATLLALVLGTTASPAFALPSPRQRANTGGNFGIGLSLVDPLGLSAKLFLSPNHALQFHLAWMPFHHHGGGLTMDYLWHPATIASGREVALVPYIGIGFGFAVWDRDRRDTYDARVGLMLRLLGGLALHWKRVPIDTVLETGWTPFLIESNPADFAPEHWDLSIKIRYYF